jgi:cobalt-zinc-cadmium resistance protein CzcA
VQVQIKGDDIERLQALGKTIAAELKTIPGTGDLRVERALGQPMLDVDVDRARLARHGVRADDALSLVEAARVGVPVGSIYEEQRRFDLRVFTPPRAPTAEALRELFVEGSGHTLVPLGEVATVTESEGVAQVRREDRRRTLRVEVNLRGRDLVSWVTEAKARIGADVDLDEGYEITWGGQFENFDRAKRRLAVVVPVSLAAIFVMLLAAFRRVRYALAVFALVPFALVGGIVGLLARGLTFSIPAAVGFVALAGIAVLNGVVITTEVKRLVESGVDASTSIRHAATHSLRAVLTTGAVAALGFLPMALATGAGAEVQRPLATVVACGILFATALTLVVFPGLLELALGRTAVKPLLAGSRHGGVPLPAS